MVKIRNSHNVVNRINNICYENIITFQNKVMIINREDIIPVSVHPFAMDNSVPEESYIEWVVKRLDLNHSGIPLGMWEEEL